MKNVQTFTAFLVLAITFIFSCSSELEMPKPPEEAGDSSSSGGNSSSSGTTGNSSSSEAFSSSSEVFSSGSVTSSSSAEALSSSSDGQGGGSSSSGNSSSSNGGTGSSSSNSVPIVESQDPAYIDHNDNLVDPRDGKKYKVAKAPNGRIWMLKNLNYSRGGTLGYCYGENTHANASTCDDGYGRLYTYDEAMDGTTSRGLCPNGWHIPSTVEWQTINGIYVMKTDDDPYAFYVYAGHYVASKKDWENRWTTASCIGESCWGFYWVGNPAYKTSDLIDYVFINAYGPAVQVRTQANLSSLPSTDRSLTDPKDYQSVRCIMDMSSSSGGSGDLSNCKYSDYCGGNTLTLNPNLMGNSSYGLQAGICVFIKSFASIQGSGTVYINNVPLNTEPYPGTSFSTIQSKAPTVDGGYYIYRDASANNASIEKSVSNDFVFGEPSCE